MVARAFAGLVLRASLVPFTCPTANRGWFWHAATGSVLLQDGWQQYLDGDTQKYWWWHEPSQDWFYEGQHCFFLLASGKGETYIKALADCRVNAIFDRHMGAFQSAHLQGPRFRGMELKAARCIVATASHRRGLDALARLGVITGRALTDGAERLGRLRLGSDIILAISFAPFLTLRLCAMDLIGQWAFYYRGGPEAKGNTAFLQACGTGETYTYHQSTG